MLTSKNSENRDKAIAYIRVSSQRQVDEGVSLDAQKRRILDYARFRGIPLDESDILIGTLGISKNRTSRISPI